MSPATKKRWNDSTIFLFRLGITFLSFFFGWWFYAAADSFFAVKNDIDLIKQWMQGYQEYRISNDEKMNDLKNVANSHAADIQNNKIDIREIKTKLNIK